MAADGAIEFEFTPVAAADVPAATVELFTRPVVESCFDDNKTEYVPAGAVCEHAPQAP